jgi:hypothetical protein
VGGGIEDGGEAGVGDVIKDLGELRRCADTGICEEGIDWCRGGDVRCVDLLPSMARLNSKRCVGNKPLSRIHPARNLYPSQKSAPVARAQTPLSTAQRGILRTVAAWRVSESNSPSMLKQQREIGPYRGRTTVYKRLLASMVGCVVAHCGM